MGEKYIIKGGTPEFITSHHAARWRLPHEITLDGIIYARLAKEKEMHYQGEKDLLFDLLYYNKETERYVLVELKPRGSEVMKGVRQLRSYKKRFVQLKNIDTNRIRLCIIAPEISSRSKKELEDQNIYYLIKPGIFNKVVSPKRN